MSIEDRMLWGFGGVTVLLLLACAVHLLGWW